jgi:hypothetical protein
MFDDRSRWPQRIGWNGNLDKDHAGGEEQRKDDASDGGGARRPDALTDQGGFLVHSSSEKPSCSMTSLEPKVMTTVD